MFIYRRTNPIVPTALRIGLTTIRTVALILLLVVVFESILNARFEKKNPPILAVAVDNSASMAITDSNGARPDVVRSILNSNFWGQLEQFDVKYYMFSNDITTFVPQRSDTLNFLGDVTNIRQALEKIKADNIVENLTNILLISDGNYNDGGNPVRDAEELGLPIHSIGVGSDQPITDLAIVTIDANPFTYAGQTTPIQVTLRNTGYDRLTVPVELRQGNVTIERQSIELLPSPSEKTVTLNYTPADIGRQKLTIAVPPPAGDRLAENNSRSFYMDVYKSKLTVMLIAGSVSPDVAFIKRILQNDRYEVSSLVHKNSGQFYQALPTADILAEVDIFIFLDFPMRGVNPAFLQNLHTSITSRNQPILLIPGFNTSLSDLNRFIDHITLQTARPQAKGEQVTVALSPLGITHPIMQVSSEAAASQSIWRQLPPVIAPLFIRELVPGSQVLAYAHSKRQGSHVMPLISIRTNGAHKSAAIFATELWRWDFMMRGINRSEDVYSRLLENIIRWLETNRSESLVRISMEKTQYSYGDPLDMKIDVFDENLNPVDNADVQITLKRNGLGRHFSAQAQGDGTYTASMQAPQPGDYQAIVNAAINGARIGEETVLFTVGEYSAELIDIQAQPAVLQSLSKATGGTFVPADSSAQLLNVMHGEKTTTPISVENELWNNKILLVLILLLLTLEWFIRKRRGMV